MTITQLTYFVAAAELHNLTKVAEMHHVSQPAVSSAIRDLEKEFQITLFERRGKELLLTETGQSAYARARKLVQHYMDTYQQFAKEGLVQNSYKVGIAKNVAAVHLCGIYSHIQNTGPAFTVNISERTIADMLSMVRHGGLDMACLAYSNISEITDLKAVPVSVLRLYLCARKDLFCSDSPELSLPDIKEVPLTVQEAPSLHNVLVRNIFREAGLQPNIKHEISQVYTQYKMVQNGLSAAIMPPELFRTSPAVKCYAIREIDPITIYLLCRHGENVQPLLHVMKDYFQSEKSLPVS